MRRQSSNTYDSYSDETGQGGFDGGVGGGAVNIGEMPDNGYLDYYHDPSASAAAGGFEAGEETSEFAARGAGRKPLAGDSDLLAG